MGQRGIMLGMSSTELAYCFSETRGDVLGPTPLFHSTSEKWGMENKVRDKDFPSVQE